MRPGSKKIYLLFACFLAFVGVLAVKLFVLQVVKHEYYAEQASKQHVFTSSIPATRGTLYDRNMKPLVVTLPAYRVFADPRMIKDALGTARTLANFGISDVRSLTAKLSRTETRFQWISRALDAETGLRVREAGIPGLYLEPSGKRARPHGDMALSVLGRMSVDDEPLGGLEQSLDRELRGKPGLRRYLRDAHGTALPCVEAVIAEPVSGHSAVLTLDADLQAFAEAELDSALARHRAQAGCIIVVDPACGDVLAMASNPREDNFGVRRVFEPGSSFKFCTISAALDLGKVDTTTIFDTNGGCLAVAGGTFIHDDHPHGVMDLADAVKYSSNVAAAMMARKIERRDFYRYMKSYGFGAKTGIQLEGESRGLLKEPDTWCGRSLETMGMGQEVGVTAIQLAMAYAALANGGTLYRPRLVKAIIDDRGNIMKPFGPKAIRRCTGSESATLTTRLLVGVVEDGTGKLAKIKGVPVAGKTGTGQKAIGGVYVGGKFCSVFAGIIPACAPRYVCIVVIDEPTAISHYGGVVCAPAFRNLMDYALRRDRTVFPEYCMSLDTVAKNLQRSANAVVSCSRPVSKAEADRPDGPVYPSLIGLTLKEAVQTLGRADIKWRAFGSGRVLDQSPAPMTPLDGHRTCTIYLG